ncbi:MAG: YaeQ family protein [Acidobacteriota bacterium]|nr:YaeQ family protein [Acidobacteriota bacterium]
MALGSTVYNFDIDLADADRGVYETLPVRAARHPSESEEFLVARLLAYCLEYEEGIEFSRGGLSDPDDPPIAVKDLTGVVKTWIDIGTPAADRLHRASKSTPRVAVYNHKDSSQWLASLKGARIHKVEELEVYAIERALVAALVEKLNRRMSFAFAVSDREVFISLADMTLNGKIERLEL